MRSLSSWGATAGAVVWVFTLCLAGCDGDSVPTAPADELFSSGPYEVGYREMTMTYSAAASMEPRELVLRVWYPAQDESGAAPARYAVAGVVDLPAGSALDAPPVTAIQLAHGIVGAFGKTEALQSDGDPLIRDMSRNAAQVGEISQVLPDRQVKVEGRLLKDNAQRLQR